MKSSSVKAKLTSISCKSSCNCLICCTTYSPRCYTALNVFKDLFLFKGVIMIILLLDHLWSPRSFAATPCDNSSRKAGGEGWECPMWLHRHLYQHTESARMPHKTKHRQCNFTLDILPEELGGYRMQGNSFQKYNFISFILFFLFTYSQEMWLR